MTVVYDENKRPSHIEREIIVRFDPAALLSRAVDDVGTQSGPLSGFVNSETARQFSQVLGLQCGTVGLTRYPTRQTISGD